MFNFVQIRGGLETKVQQRHPLKLTSDKLKRQAQATSEKG